MQSISQAGDGINPRLKPWKDIQNMQNPLVPPGSSCQVSGVFMANASSRLISARANMAGCLPGSDDEMMVGSKASYTISLHQRRSKGFKGDQQSLRCAFSTFSAGNMPGTSGLHDFVEGRMFPCGSAKEPTLAFFRGKEGSQRTMKHVCL